MFATFMTNKKTIMSMITPAVIHCFCLFKTKDAGIKYGVSTFVMELLQLTLQRLFVQICVD